MGGVGTLPSGEFSDGERRLAIESMPLSDDVVVALVLYRVVGRPGRFRCGRGWERVRTLASDRFHLRDLIGYSDYAGQLRAVARYALNGQFGCFVHFTRRDDVVTVELWERRLRDRRLVTKLVGRHEFDPQDGLAYVAALECAEEFRQRAAELNAAADLADAVATMDRARHRAESMARERDTRELLSLLERTDSPWSEL